MAHIPTVCNAMEQANSIQIVGQPFFQFVEHVMLGGRVNPFMAECFLRLANIALGELRAHEAADVVRLDMAEADLIRIVLHRTPHVDG